MDENKKKPDNKQTIEDLVREAYKDAKLKRMPFGIIFATPIEYACGTTTKYALPKNTEPEFLKSLLYGLIGGYVDILMEYYKPSDIKKIINGLYEKYELDNPEKFIQEWDEKEEDDDKPDEPTK